MPTTDHPTSGCTILEKTEHIIRHDKVRTHLYYSICKKLEIEGTENCYSHICEHEDTTVQWNQDREVLVNRPDIITTNKTDKMCLFTDVAIPQDRNVIRKEAEKEIKKSKDRNSANLEYEMLRHTSNR